MTQESKYEKNCFAITIGEVERPEGKWVKYEDIPQWVNVGTDPPDEYKEVLFRNSQGKMGVGYIVFCETYTRLVFNGTGKAVNDWKIPILEWKDITP